MTVTDAPRIVTRPLGKPRSWTLKSYLADGGYQGLRAALTMTPEQVHDHVNTANILGRGGAGFEAGRKWGMLRKAEARLPGRQRRRERTGHLQGPRPHRGRPPSAHRGRPDLRLRRRRRPGLPLHPGRVRPRPSNGCRPPSTRPTPTAPSGRNIFGSDFSVDVVVHPGAGAYICGEETALLESLEGKRGYPRIKPPFFPAAIGLYGAPTVVNNVETVSNLPWMMLNGGDAFAALGEGRSKGHQAPGAVRPRQAARQLRAGMGQGHASGSSCTTPGSAAASATTTSSRRSSPAAPPRPGSGPSTSTCSLANEAIAEVGSMAGSGVGHRHGPHHLHGAGGLAHRPLLPPGVVRPVHALPGGERLAGEDPGAHRERARAASPTSTC